MRHEDERSDAAQLAHDREQSFDLLAAKHGRRLVQDDQRLPVGSTLERQHAGELHQLPLAERQSPRLCARVDIGANTLQLRARRVVQAAPIDRAETHEARLMAEKDVLRDRQVRDQRAFLRHHADPAPRRVADRAQIRALSADANSAAIRMLDARQDLQQRRLAGAILADDANDLVCSDVQRHTREGLSPRNDVHVFSIDQDGVAQPSTLWWSFRHKQA
jgi:hypothetical protein